MAVFNYSFDEIKEPESIGLIQEQLDTDNLVSINHNNILWIELQPYGNICITYHPDNFQTSLLIRDNNGNKIAQENSGLWIPDMVTINNAINNDCAQVWIDGHSVESIIESNENKITISFYNIQGL